MGRIGFWEILVVAVIVILLFGPKKLPELGRAIGKAIKEFRKAGKEISEEVKEEEKDS